MHPATEPPPRPAPASHLPDPAFLHNITLRQLHLRFSVLRRIELPAFPGATFRGALGRVFRPQWCTAPLQCPASCQAPNTCRYFALFERDHNAEGRRIPKLWTLTAPLPPGLEDLAFGAPPSEPYRLFPQPPGRLPELRCPDTFIVDPGAELTLRLNLFGPMGAILPSIIDSLARHHLHCPGGELRLLRATDSHGSLLYNHTLPGIAVPFPPAQPLPIPLQVTDPGASRLRLMLTSPILIRPEHSSSLAPAPPEEAVSFLHALLRQSVLRTVEIHDSLSAGPRTPKIDFPTPRIKLLRHRLYRYRFSRVSLAQNRRMPWEGIVGFLELEGDWKPYLPFLRAAELLGVGQKTTAGMGRMAVAVLE